MWYVFECFLWLLSSNAPAYAQPRRPHGAPLMLVPRALATIRCVRGCGEGERDGFPTLKTFQVSNIENLKAIENQRFTTAFNTLRSA